MLIPFNSIVSKYGTPRGIIHIGAHHLEEKTAYHNENVNEIIWVEGNPEIFDRIKSEGNVYNLIVSDVDDQEYDFKITNNGQSSSILELDKHKIHHPSVRVIKEIKLKSTRMDTFLKKNDVDVNKYNFLNLDIQGAELLALKGFGELLHAFDLIYTEINTTSIYKNCALVEEIDEYLNKFNFVRKETKLTPHEWGDALYVKEVK